MGMNERNKSFYLKVNAVKNVDFKIRQFSARTEEQSCVIRTWTSQHQDVNVYLALILTQIVLNVHVMVIARMEVLVCYETTHLRVNVQLDISENDVKMPLKIVHLLTV